MKIKIEKGHLVFDVMELLEGLSPEDRRHMGEILGCEEEIVAAVVSQMLHGITDSGWSTYRDKIEKARLHILAQLDDIRLNVLTDALWRLHKAEEEQKKHSDWAWKLWHSWPDDRIRQRPNLKNAPLDDAEWARLSAEHDKAKAEAKKALGCICFGRGYTQCDEAHAHTIGKPPCSAVWCPVCRPEQANAKV